MARKGSQQKNGLNQNSTNHKKGTTDSACAVPNMKGRRKVSKGKFVGGVELPNANQSSKPILDSTDETDHVGEEIKSKQKLRKFLGKEKEGLCVTNTVEQSVPIDSSSGDCLEMKTTAEASGSREENGTPIDNGPECATTSFCHSKNGANAEDILGNLEFSDTVVMKFLRASALFILTTGTELLERQKPFFITLTTNVSNAACYVREKVEHAYPIVLKWFVQFGNFLLLLSMVWLDCALRGVDSFLRMGTMSFFSVIWCSVFSVIAMIGMFKFAVALVITALAGRLIGFTIAIILAAICGITLLWFCGSFWMTSFIICSGGFAFAMRHEKLALLIITVYSTYCARAYAGWLGLLLALNLSFISSDALIFFMRNNANSHRMPHQTPKQTTGMQGQPGFFSSEPDSSSSETGSGPSADNSPGMPSASGTDSEITSEDEVIRLLNCADHYSVLGLSRHESVDVSILKREYRKKAMLVHPDKNMGNEKAAEAFKKLQNAYEVLLDSVKRKAYDDELRREELLNFFRGIQNSSQRNGSHSIFGSGFARTDGDSEDPFGESKRISCRKCGNFHIWIHTKKIKLTARWCQDCKDFHQAKDGDGWVEQSSQPFLFGILQKVDAPRAYVCADSRIYDANEWYICQGMRCPANTHKPSFHVNTSLTPKHNNGKASAPRGPMPSSNPEESMTEEQFFEWLQNAVQAGVFDHFSAGTSSDSPFTRAGNNSKTGGSYSGSGSNSKRKKKGKKQW